MSGVSYSIFPFSGLIPINFNASSWPFVRCHFTLAFAEKNQVKECIPISQRIRKPVRNSDRFACTAWSSVARRIARTKESTLVTSLEAIFHGGANETVIRLNSIRVAAAEAVNVKARKRSQRGEVQVSSRKVYL